MIRHRIFMVYLLLNDLLLGILAGFVFITVSFSHIECVRGDGSISGYTKPHPDIGLLVIGVWLGITLFSLHILKKQSKHPKLRIAAFFIANIFAFYTVLISSITDLQICGY